MDRLTRKTNEKDYTTHCEYIEKTNELFEQFNKPLKPEEYYKSEPYKMEDRYILEDAMNRLGKIEDLMDEYNIHSVEELSQVLEEHCKNGETLYFCDRCGCQSLRESDRYCPECGGKVED